MLKKKSRGFICVRPMGGLGNQMFQYAIGRALSVRYNVPFYLDKTSYRSPFSRPYALDVFQLSTLEWVSRAWLWYTLIKRAFRRLHRVFRSPTYKQLVTLFFQVCCGVAFYTSRMYRHKEFERLRPPVFLFDEYWQCERYFKAVADVIRKDFDLTRFESPRTQPLLAKIRQPNTVSLHVRKGDYAAVAQLPRTYYEKAIQRIGQLVSNPYFFVFSDEMDKAQTMLKGLLPQATYVSDPHYSAHEEMLLMNQCAHHIIANSTFSWWAAWLSVPRADRHILAPYLWYLDGKLKYRQDIYCEGWILL